MNAIFTSRTFVAAILTAAAAIATATGVLPHEVAANHIDTAATLILALITAWSHGNTTGVATAVETAIAASFSTPAAPAAPTTDQPAK